MTLPALLIALLASPELSAPNALAAPGPFAPALQLRLQRAAPDLAPEVLAAALHASRCALRQGHIEDVPQRLAVIDYSLPSTRQRLWVFDLHEGHLLYREHVAHGRGSGADLAQHFSNREGSHQSSLGLFRTAETYHGGNGYSLRMDGLEPGLNDQARARHIVMHGAAYVNPAAALQQGRLGRSLGCPAVRPAVAQELIDQLKDGQLLFAWHGDTEWQAASTLMACR